MSLLGGALIVLLRAAGEQEGKGASSVSPATRPRGRHNFCGQQESTSPEGGFLVNLSQQMAPFSGGRITGESPPARLLHAGGRVGSVRASVSWWKNDTPGNTPSGLHTFESGPEPPALAHSSRACRISGGMSFSS